MYMLSFGLTQRERKRIEALIATALDGNMMRRGLALLRLDEGESAASVAEFLQISRQTLYNWTSAFQERQNMDLYLRLSEGPHPGRPRRLHGKIESLLETVLDVNPLDLGYPSTVWTAALLSRYLEEKHGIIASNRSVRYALKRLDYQWKRPRHTLARRSPTWQQQKGGLKKGFPGVLVPSF
jgi:transposase